MTSSISSLVQLLRSSPPLDRLPESLLVATEDRVNAWRMELGGQLALEGAPFGFVLFVVEGTLRVSGRDVNGKEFTIRRIGPGQWWGGVSALHGVALASCRTAEDCKLLAVPVELWQEWWNESAELRAWHELNLQKEDFYSSLRPL